MMNRLKKTRCVTGCLALLFMSVTVASAAVTNDRVYSLGDDDFENAVAETAVGSASSNGKTFDSEFDGIDGGNQFFDAQDLDVVGSPQYVDVTARPGAVAASLGASFNGTSDALTGIALNRPDQYYQAIELWGSEEYPRRYEGVTRHGVQFWANPNSDKQDVRQDLVVDSVEFGGVIITPNNNWAMLYDIDDAEATVGNGGVFESSEAVAFDQWSHLMMVSLSDNANTVLFVNGKAVGITRAVDGDGVLRNFAYDTIVIDTDDPNDLFVGGSDLDKDETYENHYQGQIDDLDMFVYGNTGGEIISWGVFNLASDNGYIALEYSDRSLADLNDDGVVDDADTTVFVSNWLDPTAKDLQGFIIADIESMGMGDLNTDGIVDLADWHLYTTEFAAQNPNAPALNLGLLLNDSVPEPASLMLLGLASGAMLRRRNR